jgi:SAM-dependent methyltransferase
MYEPNVQRILELLAPDDVVLDIGGWACPFNRANYILDAEPYETRGYYRTFGGAPFQAGAQERFTKDTWIRRDICEHTPFPFADKSVDFVICSHTLEDLRDPLWVCQEMVRIGKRGYIEVPSRAAETSRGWEHPRIAGLSHHRWLIEIDNSHIRFLMKYHRLHSHWRLSLPAAYLRALPESAKVQWLFWTERFSWEEITIHGLDGIDGELERFVAATQPYPSWHLEADATWRRITGFFTRGRAALSRWSSPPGRP